MAYSDDTQSVVNRLRNQINQLNHKETRDTAIAWARGWDDVAPELARALDELVIAAGQGRLTRAQVLRSQRLANALDLVTVRLGQLLDRTAADVIGDLEHMVNNAAFMTELMVKSQLPSGAIDPRELGTWSRVHSLQIDAIVDRTTEQITARTLPLSREATRVMKRELVRGMLVGTNPRESARRMMAKTEQRFNGGLSRALTIARTETMDAYRLAAQIVDSKYADVILGWTWVATLGERTCPACWAMHGQQFPPSVPGPLGHQNCRCVRVPMTKTWKDLGFNVEEPPSTLVDARAAFAALGKSEQLKILGPARFAAYKAGDFPMEKWAKRRDTPEWRPSYVPAPAPRAA